MSRLVSVLVDGKRRAGVLDGDKVWITEHAGIDAVLQAGMDLGALASQPGSSVRVEDVRLDAPLRPPVVLCMGQNYRDHLEEKAPITLHEPEFFLKAGQTLAAPDEPCVLDPRVTRKLDYETELGIVVGRPGRHLTPEQALDVVAGYVVLNDVTARDRQVIVHDDGTTTLALGPGKNFDGSTRMGTSLVTADEIDDPQRLGVRTTVNGELRQDNSTASMIFPVPELLAFLSRLLTLQPGMVIATGTPGGTGWGTDAELGGTSRTPAGCVPARYLAAGDEVVGVIDGVGTCSFTVIGPS
jgi:2-keto-4-pentenoate hydratase/2-oxohepta-3-ene-1,7-dioic acid hydratase in catechol pathway